MLSRILDWNNPPPMRPSLEWKGFEKTLRVGERGRGSKYKGIEEKRCYREKFLNEWIYGKGDYKELEEKKLVEREDSSRLDIEMGKG